MKKLLFAALLIPTIAFTPVQPPRPDARDRMDERVRVQREIDRERAAWREDVLQHELDCRRERDRINRNHEERIRQIIERNRIRR